MSKIKDFFRSLKKSTKMTIISCTCCVVLTAVILSFFVMFPTTLSEKVITGFGREGIYKEVNQSEVVTTTVVTTTGNDIIVAKTTRTTTRPKTTRTEFTIKVTSGSGFAGGFYVDNRIPTGVYPNEYFPTTTTTADVSGGGDEPQPSTDIGNGGGDIPQPTTDGGNGSGGGNGGGNDTPQPPTDGGGNGSGGGNSGGGDTPAPDPGSSETPETE